MRRFILFLLILLIPYAVSYLIFRSANIQTSSIDKKSIVIYATDDYVYKLFRPAAYVDEYLTGAGSHIGPEQGASTTFQTTGVLDQNKPGQKSGVWYLIYQDSSGLTSTIELSGVSRSGYTIGDRVEISGTKQGDLLRVSRISRQKLY